MSYDSKRDGNIAAEKLFSAEHEARVERQYCDLTGQDGDKFHCKALSGLLRVVSVVGGVQRISYFDREEAEKLRDFLNEWWPARPNTGEEHG